MVSAQDIESCLVLCMGILYHADEVCMGGGLDNGTSMARVLKAVAEAGCIERIPDISRMNDPARVK